MKSHLWFTLTLLIATSVRPGIARGEEASSAVEISTSDAGLMLVAGAPWNAWLQANYPRKGAFAKEQEQSLDKTAGANWDARFVGDIFKDGEPGAMLMKFSPSGKTLTRFKVLRWSKGDWTPMLECGRKKVVYGKHAPITSNVPVDVYQVYLEKETTGLGIMVTLGSAGDKLFGDAVSLAYDAQTRNYVEPDDTDHD